MLAVSVLWTGAIHQVDKTIQFPVERVCHPSPAVGISELFFPDLLLALVRKIKMNHLQATIKPE